MDTMDVTTVSISVMQDDFDVECAKRQRDDDSVKSPSTSESTASSATRSSRVDHDLLRCRPLQEDDRDEIQQLHQEWFPVVYEEEFYDEVVKNRMFTTGNELYSRVFTYEHQIAACVVGSFLHSSKISRLTRDLILPGNHSMVFYIMTLGTVTQFRHVGLATRLIESCIDEVEKQPECGALYLHVITFNLAAIRFYEKLGFYRVTELEDYYVIDGKHYNCYLYAKYFHGNRGHRTLSHLIGQLLSYMWDKVMTPATKIQEIVSG